MPQRFHIFLIIILAASSVFAQQAEIPINNREDDTDFKRERDEWIRDMHRAEPGLNWQAIDAETRNAKFEAVKLLRNKHSVLPQSLVRDTLAGGRIFGSWAERGSNNISGRMHTLDIDFDHNTVYAASAMGNIWKADLGDVSKWRSLNDDKRFGDIRMLRVITTSKGKRIIAVANGPVASHYSDDDGITWQLATGLDGPKNWGGIKRACMDAREQNIYLCGNEWDYKNWYAVATLYRSTDQGKTFTNLGQWKTSSDHCDVWVSRDTISSAYFLKDDSLFSITANGSLKFAHSMTYVDSLNNIGWLLLQGVVNNNKLTLTVLQTGGGFSQIYYSGNGGNTWNHSGTMTGNPFGVNSFKVLQSDPKTIAIGTVETFVSRDSGKMWNHTNGWGEYYGNMKTKLHADIDGIDFIQSPTGEEMQFVSTDGGIFMSKDTLGSFENITLTGIGTGQFYSVMTSSKPPYYVYGGTQDQGYQRAHDSVGGTFGMQQTISGDYGHLTSSNLGKSVWCDYPGFAMLYADAEGSTSNRTWNFKGSNHLWIPPMLSDPLNPQAAYIACGGDSTASWIWHLVNGKDTVAYSHWSFDFSTGNKDRKVSAIAFSPMDLSHCYVLTNDGYFFDSLGVDGKWKRTDSTGLGSHYFYGSVILPSVKDRRTLWIAGSGYSNPGVYVSTDEGITFSPVDSGLPKTLVFGLAATEDEQFLFAATEVGPYVYSKQAGRWFDMSLGHAPDMVYWSVEYIPSLKVVRFGTYGRGIWDFAIDNIKYSVTPDSLCPPIPNFNLSAVPSVFSANTTISFNLPTDGIFAVHIYDITGKLVRTVVNDRLDLGWHHIRWDGRSDNGAALPSGYYTCIASGLGKADFIKIDLVK